MRMIHLGVASWWPLLLSDMIRPGVLSPSEPRPRGRASNLKSHGLQSMSDSVPGSGLVERVPRSQRGTPATREHMEIWRPRYCPLQLESHSHDSLVNETICSSAQRPVIGQ